MTDDVPGIGLERLLPWFREHVAEVSELRPKVVGHGRSNLTYRMDTDKGAWVLRRVTVNKRENYPSADSSAVDVLERLAGKIGQDVPAVTGSTAGACVSWIVLIVAFDSPLFQATHTRTTPGRFSPLIICRKRKRTVRMSSSERHSSSEPSTRLAHVVGAIPIRATDRFATRNLTGMAGRRSTAKWVGLLGISPIATL